MSFGEDAQRLLARAGIAGAGFDVRRPHGDAELAAKRRMGRAAHERAMAAWGMPADQARIYASAHFLWDDPGE